MNVNNEKEGILLWLAQAIRKAIQLYGEDAIKTIENACSVKDCEPLNLKREVKFNSSINFPRSRVFFWMTKEFWKII